MIACVKRGTIAVIWMISPPLRILEMTAGPPDPATSAAPESMALKSADEAPINTGSKSIPCLSNKRASLATNQGKQLSPMGEKGNGTFFGACAALGVGSSNRSKSQDNAPAIACQRAGREEWLT